MSKEPECNKQIIYKKNIQKVLDTERDIGFNSALKEVEKLFSFLECACHPTIDLEKFKGLMKK